MSMWFDVAYYPRVAPDYGLCSYMNDVGLAPSWELSRSDGFIKAVPEVNPTGEAAWTDPYEDIAGNPNMISLLVPFYIHTDSNGDVTGVTPSEEENAEYFGILGADVMLTATESVLTDLLVTKSGLTLIFNYDGFLITATQAAIDMFYGEGTALATTVGQSIKTTNSTHEAEMDAAFEKMMATPVGEVRSLVLELNGEPYTWGYFRLASAPWIMVVSAPQQEIDLAISYTFQGALELATTLPDEHGATSDEVTTAVVIENTGHLDVSYEVAKLPDWLELVSPSTGSVPAGSTFDLIVTTQAANLPFDSPGTYFDVMTVFVRDRGYRDCDYSAVEVADVAITLTYPLSPCTSVGCGDYAECGVETGICRCKSGFDMSPGVTESMHNMAKFNCELPRAMASEQRLFWSVGSLISMFSLLAVTLSLYQFWWGNPGTKNAVVKSYLAILIPDAVLALTYFLFTLWSSVGGHPVGGNVCQLISFLNYGVILATFAGPSVVALVTYKKFVLLSKNNFKADPYTTQDMTVILSIPWVIGLVCGSIVMGEGMLGSYRGLVCYAKDFSHVLTGGLTSILFLLSSGSTTILYAHLYKVLVSQNVGDNVARGTFYRGLKFVTVLFVLWSVFAVVGLMVLMGGAPPVWAEVLGGMMFSLQGLVDSYMFLSMKPVRNPMFLKMSREGGGSSKFTNNRRTAPDKAADSKEGQQQGSIDFPTKESSKGAKSLRATEAVVVPQSEM